MGCIRRQAPCFGIELSARTPLHRRIEIRLVRKMGFCFGYLSRRNVASRRPFSSSRWPCRREDDTAAALVSRTSHALVVQFRSSSACSTSRMRNTKGAVGLYGLRSSTGSLVARCVRLSCPSRAVDRQGRLRSAAPASKRSATWLILPVVICLSQRLSHACVSMNKFRL